MPSHQVAVDWRLASVDHSAAQQPPDESALPHLSVGFGPIPCVADLDGRKGKSVSALSCAVLISSLPHPASWPNFFLAHLQATRRSNLARFDRIIHHDIHCASSHLLPFTSEVAKTPPLTALCVLPPTPPAASPARRRRIPRADRAAASAAPAATSAPG